MKIAFIGLGVMGAPMAGHLVSGGHDVIGYDPDPDTAPGLPRADSAAKAVEGAEIVLTMLPNGHVVSDVARGFAPALSPGALVVDCSSAEPWLTLETAARIESQGGAMIDAPVSGAEWGAKAAELVFMAGGVPEHVERARPVLELMGKSVHYLGPLGAGHRMKALNNVVTAMAVIATTEAMLVGKSYGLDPAAMTDVLNESTGQSFWSSERLHQDVLNRAFEDGFKLSLMRKDVDIAARLGREAGKDTPMLTLAEEMWARADKEMGEGRAVTEMVKWIEERMGETLGAPKA